MRKYILFLMCSIIPLGKCPIISLRKCPTISSLSLMEHLIINISFQSGKIAIDEKRRH